METLIALNDPRVPDGWRQNNKIRSELSSGSHQLIWEQDEDGERLVLKAIKAGCTSGVYDRKYDPKYQPTIVRAALAAPARSVASYDHGELLEKWEREDAADSSAKLTTPDPETLRRSLLSRFQSKDGWNYCSPFGKWNPPGKPFLAGYATTWGTPTDERSHCRCHLVMRQGCFSQALSTGSPTVACLGHHLDLAAASTADKTLAIVQDEHGLAVFADASRWKYGAALASLIRDGKLSQMSFLHQPDPNHVDTFTVGGRSYKESLSVAALPEVSFVPVGGNQSTLALAIGGRYDYSCGHDHDRAYLLHMASRPKE